MTPTILTLCLSRFSKATLLFFTGCLGSVTASTLVGLWPLEECGNSIRLKSRFLFTLHPETLGKLHISLETMFLKVTTTEHRMVRWTVPLISRPLHLVSPFLAHLRVLREEKQTYSIPVGVATASSDTALHHRPPCASGLTIVLALARGYTYACVPLVMSHPSPALSRTLRFWTPVPCKRFA